MVLDEVSMSHPGDRSLPLTVEERRALSLSATGLTVTEVAEAMGTSPEVVRLWLASAIDKLGARSKLEAVLIAGRARSSSTPSAELDPRSGSPLLPPAAPCCALVAPTATHGPNGAEGPPSAGGWLVTRVPRLRYLAQEFEVIGDASPSGGGTDVVVIQAGQVVEVVEYDPGVHLGRQGAALAEGDAERGERALSEERA